MNRKGKRKARKESGSGGDLLEQIDKEKEKAVETDEKALRGQKKCQRSKS